MPLLGMLLRWFAGFMLAKFFISLAIGIFTYSIVQYFFDQYINGALQQFQYIGDVAKFMAIAQLDKSISIIMGALSIRAFMQSVKVAFGKN